MYVLVLYTVYNFIKYSFGFILLKFSNLDLLILRATGLKHIHAYIHLNYTLKFA